MGGKILILFHVLDLNKTVFLFIQIWKHGKYWTPKEGGYEMHSLHQFYLCDCIDQISLLEAKV